MKYYGITNQPTASNTIIPPSKPFILQKAGSCPAARGSTSTPSKTTLLNDFFKPVTPDKAIFGETIIGVNYSGGLPQHFMVYAGKDNSGNIYVMQKYGMSEAPNIIKMSEVGTGMHKDQKFFNENGAQR